MNYAGNESRSDLERVKNLTRVESPFYPALALHHGNVTESWYRQQKKGLSDGVSAAS